MLEDEFFGTAYTGPSQGQPESRADCSVGFGAPSSTDHGIDLNEQLVRNKQATYFFRMKGDAMRDAGIFDNDLLVVDRSLKLQSGKVIVAILNGELLVRRFHRNFSSAFLIPENSRYKNINLAEFSDFSVWGVVTYVIHALG